MTSSEVLATIWKDLTLAVNINDVHGLTSNAVEAVLKESINRRTLDNITVVMVAF
jgi:protein phosphatase 2C family protein 2/3